MKDSHQGEADVFKLKYCEIITLRKPMMLVLPICSPVNVRLLEFWNVLPCKLSLKELFLHGYILIIN